MKTTAISKYNAAATRNSGRVGNIRYVQKNGETYVRSAVNSKVTNKRTTAQMTQRMKFASVVALCSAMKEFITGAFPGKEANQSWFNAFVQANQGLGVYRTKNEVLDKVITRTDLLIDWHYDRCVLLIDFLTTSLPSLPTSLKYTIGIMIDNKNPLSVLGKQGQFC